MQPGELLTELKDRLTCSYCTQLLHSPRTIASCQHSLCRICLDQLLSSNTPRCPQCQQAISCTSSNLADQRCEQLLKHYYRIKAQIEIPAVDKTCSRVAAQSIKFPSSPPTHGLQPLASQSSDCPTELLLSMPRAASQKKSAPSAADSQGRSGILDDLLDDSGLSSGSETDLDLPEPMSFLDTSPSPNKPLPKEPLLAHDESEQAAEKTSKLRRGSQRPKDDVKDTAAAPSSQVPTPTTPKSPSRSKAAASMYSAKSSRRTRTSSLTVVDDAVDNNSDEHAVDDRDESRRLKRASKSTADESKSKRRRSLKDKTAISEQTVSSLSSSPLAGKDEDADQPVRLQLLTTGLTEAQATRLRRAVKRAGTQLSWSVNVHSDPGFLRNAAQYAKNTEKNGGSTYSHLVTVPGKDNRTARTFKYLAGLVSGAWVVSMDWILESIKARRLLPETDFTIDGDTALSQYTLTGPRQIGHLFNGYAIYVRGKLEVGSAYTSADVVNLIRATGALVVPRLEAEDDENSSPKTKSATRQQKQPRQQQWPGKKKRGADKKLSNLRDAHRRLFEIPVSTETTVVLIDIDSLSAEKAKEELDEIVEVTGGACPCRTKTWFFDCISANEVLP